MQMPGKSKPAGFLKTGSEKKQVLSSSQRSALIRRGNEFFNRGEYETAKKIFVTTSYSDGLIRMGDYYKKKGNTIEALKMYRMAPAKEKFDQILEQTAAILSRWLEEE